MYTLMNIYAHPTTPYQQIELTSSIQLVSHLAKPFYMYLQQTDIYTYVGMQPSKYLSVHLLYLTTRAKYRV